MKRYAVIVAAGTGSRMNSGLPKQFLLLNGKPVLYYSLLRFNQNDPATHIILVLAKEEVERWGRLCDEHQITIPHQIVIGGKTRTESVQNGLKAVSENGLVAIHDGARPLVSNEIIEKCYESAFQYGSGVVSVKPKDSIRQIVRAENHALDRDTFRLIHTPQTFKSDIIKYAFKKFGKEASTDDATIVEKAGFRIFLVEGSYVNFKITTPEDLVLAEALFHHSMEQL